jgi:hypothetical protein
MKNQISEVIKEENESFRSNTGRNSPQPMERNNQNDHHQANF